MLIKITRLLKRHFFIFLVFMFAVSPFCSKAMIDFGDNLDFDLSGSGIKIIVVAPPEIFTLPESQTNITRVCTFGEALNIVLDVPEYNSVKFHEPIVDMCDNETIENLDEYIQIDKTGEVSVDSESLTYLKDVSATVVMRDLPFDQEPDVEVDGNLATEDDIENKIWDQSSKTLTFDVKHFSTYKAVPSSSEYSYISDSYLENQQEYRDNKELLLICFASSVIAVLVITLLVVYLIRKK